jgi:hypothetical protein
MTTIGTLYEFSFRGQLTEEALDRAGRTKFAHSAEAEAAMAERLSLGLLDDEAVAAARQMSTVYTAIAAFENSARTLVTSTLLEEKGESWWDECVSEKVRKSAESRQQEDEENRFHSRRGESPLNYTDLKGLLSIVRNNWTSFEPFMPTIEWAANIFDAIERSRNVIMHSGSVDDDDVARVGIHIRDWVKQVGA